MHFTEVKVQKGPETQGEHTKKLLSAEKGIDESKELGGKGYPKVLGSHLFNYFLKREFGKTHDGEFLVWHGSRRQGRDNRKSRNYLV